MWIVAPNILAEKIEIVSEMKERKRERERESESERGWVSKGEREHLKEREINKERWVRVSVSERE